MRVDPPNASDKALSSSERSVELDGHLPELFLLVDLLHPVVVEERKDGMSDDADAAGEAHPVGPIETRKRHSSSCRRGCRV